MPEPDRHWRPAPLLRVSAALHAAGLCALALAPRWWRPVVGMMVLDHVLLATACTSPRSPLLGPNLARLTPRAARGRGVALTFDDGPDPRVTPRVLDLLEARGARASFFLIGRRAERHPELVAEIVRRGHRVENHTYHHAHTFAFLGPRALGREIDRAQRVLAGLAGRPPRFFRAPAGMRSLWLDAVLARRGLALVSWTRRGYDTVESDPRRVARRLLRHLAPGDVLLLHDGSAARDRRGRPVVLDALPRVLDALEGRGLRPMPLPDMSDVESMDGGREEARGLTGPAR